MPKHMQRISILSFESSGIAADIPDPRSLSVDDDDAYHPQADFTSSEHLYLVPYQLRLLCILLWHCIGFMAS